MFHLIRPPSEGGKKNEINHGTYHRLRARGSAGGPGPATTSHCVLSVFSRGPHSPHVLSRPAGVRACVRTCPAPAHAQGLGPLACVRACVRGRPISGEGAVGGMPPLLHLCLLWLGLLLVRFSQEQSYESRARKLCGRHLLRGIVKLCGDADWSHSKENTPLKKQLALQDLEKVESFIPGRSKSSPNTSRVRGRGTNAGKHLNRRRVGLSVYVLSLNLLCQMANFPKKWNWCLVHS